MWVPFFSAATPKWGFPYWIPLTVPLKQFFMILRMKTRQGLKSGRINAAITQAPRDQGYQSINVLFQYFTSGKIPPKDILMDSQIMFKESID